MVVPLLGTLCRYLPVCPKSLNHTAFIPAHLSDLIPKAEVHASFVSSFVQRRKGDLAERVLKGAKARASCSTSAIASSPLLLQLQLFVHLLYLVCIFHLL